MVTLPYEPPSTVTAVPTFNAPLTPAPPATTRAPVVVFVLAVPAPATMFPLLNDITPALGDEIVAPPIIKLLPDRYRSFQR